MICEAGREEEVRKVLLAAAEAVDGGWLPVWTVYNRPKDYPDGFIARMHVSGSEGSSPTDHTLTGDLETIRQILRRAGLTRLDRHPRDEPQILETWL